MGVGFAKDGESRNRQNTALRSRLKDKYFLKQEYSIKKRNSLVFKKATPQDLKRIRLKLAKQKNSETIISVVVFVFLIGLLIYCIL